MARQNGKSPSARQWWAALLFFVVGVALLLLTVFGPVVWGDKFDGSSLKTPALGLIFVGVYVATGVSIAALLSGRWPNGAGNGDDDGKGRNDG